MSERTEPEKTKGEKMNVSVKRAEIPILVVNALYILIFGGMSLAPPVNYEFVIYALVIVVFFTLILLTQRRVEFPRFMLWGLTLWGFLHMAGGHLDVGGKRLYELVLLPVLTRGADTIFRYDHAVHLVGFGVATLVCYHLLRPHLKHHAHRNRMVCVLAVLMGMGLGAFNEVIELLVVMAAPESGVGGYFNTAFDLLFNMAGAVLAVAGLQLFGGSYLTRTS